jgi:hypothetical protein
VDGPAITIGPSVLSLNKDHDLNLDGLNYLLAGVCPALLIPVTNPNPVAGPRLQLKPSSSSLIIVPSLPGARSKPSNDNNRSTPVTPGPFPNSLITTVIPGTPNDPSNPNKPSDPNTPDKPSDPNTPSSPDKPADPNSTNKQDKPKIPGSPLVSGCPPNSNVPVVTPPPTRPGLLPIKPDNEKPNECETKPASIYTQGCSFGTNVKSTTTTTSCAKPNCTIKQAAKCLPAHSQQQSDLKSVKPR